MHRYIKILAVIFLIGQTPSVFSGSVVQAHENIKKSEILFEKLVKEAQTKDFSCPPNTAVFWTGYQDEKFEPRREQEAIKWAKANQKFTVEMTPGGQWMRSLKLYTPESPITDEQANVLWRNPSKRFAESASGNVVILANPLVINLNDLLYQIELIALWHNPKVRTITYQKLDMNNE